MKLYIKASACISPQKTFGQESFPSEPEAHRGDRLNCIEPDYSNLIDPKSMRRMSRIIKMGVATALECLRKSAVRLPDAIITGTAYGCLEDTAHFLSRMVENQEELLTPTAFIQSTHNTVGAQIALLLKCHQYNNTFVHRGFSFENALLDAMMLIREQEAKNVLVGAVDEITNTSHQILQRFGLYKREPIANLDLFASAGKGTMAGEGAAFFLLTSQADPSNEVELQGMHSFYKPGDIRDIEKNISGFLEGLGIQMHEIDLVITGNNGDAAGDYVYHALEKSLFNNIPLGRFKHLCGEYPTAAAFAVWLSAN
ncbi:MAG TPA: beta-ketoacyl synthase chain length factor, partial [Puia sp.]|nr:beta-ketoacyl synthase chain length factor [Puia sp.]